MKRLASLAAAIGVAATPSVSAPPRACAACIAAHEAQLTALSGRGCATSDEHAAAEYIAGQLKAYGIAGAAPDGGYLQEVRFRRPTFSQTPQLAVGDLRLEQGRDILMLEPAPAVEGPLTLVGLAEPEAAAGKVAIYDAPFDPRAVHHFFNAGAVAVITQAPERALKNWRQLAARPPEGVQVLGADVEAPAVPSHTLVFARPEALAALRRVEGQVARLTAPRGEPQLLTTYNVLGRLPGTGRDADRAAILLTSHYDHLGVVDGVVYPGANDDASGSTAVLELARILAQGPPHRRTALFALFGCEETGGQGARYFLDHPSAPLEDIAANIEFEMIGAVDPRHPRRLMLTGWERSNLGPTLSAHGALLTPDIDPDERFFERSDNYQLARRGVVAQTVTGWPTPPTYHQPTDDLAHLDQAFMVRAIQSMTGPIGWLLDADFRPEWTPGGKP